VDGGGGGNEPRRKDKVGGSKMTALEKVGLHHHRGRRTAEKMMTGFIYAKHEESMTPKKLARELERLEA